ncbi:MAG: Stk1 family PASTA domain-containing Ser/Thr kinase [Acutalibacteraceae bacterium]
MDKYTGKRLDGRYEIQELIGVGGMAVVYRAYDIIEDKIVAIKILKDEFLGNKEFIRRFKNESKAIAVLSHPNIVKVYDVSFGTKIQYIVMEYIDGTTLKEYISRRKVINWKDALYFVNQILSALRHAHNKGVIHRDIKPQNIMLLKDGTIKVTDFGIARFSSNETQTMTDRAIGSVHYISPEQARGSIIDEKADLYSVGIMLYEMITGKLPFEADNAVSVAIMQMQATPKPPREINPDIPKGLEQIIMHSMEKDPARRYESAEEMANDIHKLQENADAVFKYKHFDDNNPTRYVDKLEDVSSKKSNYGDDYNYRETKKNNKTKVGFIAAGIATVVGLFALLFIFLNYFGSCGNRFTKDVDVPNLIGKTLSEVQENPEYKFVWKIESVYDSTKPDGIILDQDPLPGSKKIKEDGTITLKVNSPGVLIAVPNVKGLTEDVAKSKLTNAGLKYEVLMVMSEDVSEGIVSNVSPQEGSKVTSDTTVKLYVSKGKGEEKVLVPDVINKSLAAAKNEIIAAGLKVSDNVSSEDSDKPKGTVITTDPLPSVLVPKDSTVKIVVSTGVKREKTVEVAVDLPATVKHEVEVTYYIDGGLEGSKKVVPAYNGNYSIYVKGNSGTKTLHVKLDGADYRAYKVDFDNNKVIKTFADEYKESSTDKVTKVTNKVETDENKIYNSSASKD